MIVNCNQSNAPTYVLPSWKAMHSVLTGVNMQCTALALIIDGLQFMFVLVTKGHIPQSPWRSIHKSKFYCKIHENLCNLMRIRVAVLNLCVVCYMYIWLSYV